MGETPQKKMKRLTLEGDMRRATSLLETIDVLSMFIGVLVSLSHTVPQFPLHPQNKRRAHAIACSSFLKRPISPANTHQISPPLQHPSGVNSVPPPNLPSIIAGQY
jgi:hypothetical protein